MDAYALGKLCGTMVSVAVGISVGLWIRSKLGISANFTAKKAIVGISIGLIFGMGAAWWHSNSPAAGEAQLQKMSQDVNKRLPLMVDAMTRFDTTRAGPGKHFSYFYTVVNMRKADVERNIDRFTEVIRPRLVNIYKTNPTMGALRRQKIELSYYYRDKNGEPITTITISPKDF